MNDGSGVCATSATFFNSPEVRSRWACAMPVCGGVLWVAIYKEIESAWVIEAPTNVVMNSARRAIVRKAKLPATGTKRMGRMPDHCTDASLYMSERNLTSVSDDV